MTKEELVRDRMMSAHAMVQSLQTQILTCAVRGKLSHNMRNEMESKLAWLAGEIGRTCAETN